MPGVQQQAPQGSERSLQPYRRRYSTTRRYGNHRDTKRLWTACKTHDSGQRCVKQESPGFCPGEVQLLSLAARYVPNTIMIAPVTVLCRLRKTAEDRIRLPSGPARAITMRSAAVFISTEIVPSITNCKNTCPPLRLTNCGMKERKNKAVFGFRASVATPCQSGLCPDWSGGEIVSRSKSSPRAPRIIRIPRKPR